MKIINRRQFLATTSAAVMFPYVGRVLGANNKLNIGVVGVAGRGASNLKGVSDENIAALCDVSVSNLARAKKQFSKAVFQIISNFPTQLSKSQGNSVEFCLF